MSTALAFAQATVMTAPTHSTSATKPHKVVVLYSRLSREDGDKSESDSIQHQKILLEQYAEKNGLTPFVHICDDGYSGSDWRRPGWVELIDMVDNDRVSTICLKDNSRFGRDFLRVGLYREFFKERNVRIIAVNDGYDSFKGDDDLLPFRDIFAEWHARDTSNKIRAIFKSHMANGKRCSGSVPYGFKKNNGDVNDLIIDEEAATVIRRIFNMVIEGKGVNDIARTLMNEQVPIPNEHRKRNGMETRIWRESEPYGWTSTTVGYILRNPEYKGTLVLGKTKYSSYKGNKKILKTAPEEQFVFENALPAIVSPEVWENAQRLRRTVRKAPKIDKEPNPLTGLLWCETCGAKMSHRHSLSSRGHEDNSYICSKYRRDVKRVCTAHYISVKNLNALILDVLQKVSVYAKAHEKDFIAKVRELSEQQQDNAIKETKKMLTKFTKRIDELDGLIKKLYESFAAGKIPEKHFEKLLADYDSEQTTLEVKIVELQSEIDTFNDKKLRADSFMELINRYTNFTELTPQILNNFIDKIIVHEKVKDELGAKTQQVDIYLNFIGNFTIPQEPLTPAELEAERKRAIKNFKQRESNKRQRAKRKAEQDALQKAEKLAQVQ